MRTNRTDSAAYFPVPTSGPVIEAYTIPDFCRAFGVGRSFTYEEIKAGRLPIRKAGRRTLISVQAAREWFDSLGGQVA